MASLSEQPALSCGNKLRRCRDAQTPGSRTDAGVIENVAVLDYKCRSGIWTPDGGAPLVLRRNQTAVNLGGDHSGVVIQLGDAADSSDTAFTGYGKSTGAAPSELIITG